MTDEQIEQLAERIATILFTVDRDGPMVSRLALVNSQGRDMGGWIKRAVVMVITRTIKEELCKQPS